LARRRPFQGGVKLAGNGFGVSGEVKQLTFVEPDAFAVIAGVDLDPLPGENGAELNVLAIRAIHEPEFHPDMTDVFSQERELDGE
jgi:hypothetical protein